VILVDVAHNHSATQTLTYGYQDAGYAVDGNPVTCSVTRTGSETIYPWWQVDLQDQYTVNYITVLASTGILSE